jgi:hypothetical protein
LLAGPTSGGAMTVGRARCLLVAITVVGCSGASSLAPGTSIAGSWGTYPPGAPIGPGGEAGFLLSESGNAVTGTYQDIPFQGTFSVAGTYDRPNVTLVLTPVSSGGGRPDSVETVTGYVKNGSEMVVEGTTYYKQ